MKKQTEQVLTLAQLTALCLTPQPALPKRHDKLLEVVLLMAYLGLRVSEAINFTWQTIPVEDKLAFIVQGKGQKQRLIGLVRIDRKGESYWKFKEFTKEEVPPMKPSRGDELRAKAEREAPSNQNANHEQPAE